MTETCYAHIVLREDGQPIIAEKGNKVRGIALYQRVWGCDASGIQEHVPELTLGEIYSALAYYADHQEAMNRDMDERERRVDEAQRQSMSRRPELYKGFRDTLAEVTGPDGHEAPVAHD